MSRRGKLAAGLGLAIAAILLISPVGQPLLSGVENALGTGWDDLAVSFQEMFPTAAAVGPAPATQSISVGLALPVNNDAGLQSYIQAASTPGSPTFDHFLTPAEFNAQYAPSAASYRTLEAYFGQYDVQLQSESNRLILTVEGSPAQVGAAFHTSFEDYRVGSQVFFGPTSAPGIPSDLGVTAAYGFTDATYNVPTNLLDRATPAGSATPAASCSTNGNGDSSGYNPTQIQDAYGANTLHSTANGTGMKLAIVDGYDSAITATSLGTDLSDFDSDCGLAKATVNYNYPVPSTTLNSSSSSGWGGEEVLDMDWSHTMAPGATLEMTFSPNSGIGLYQAVDWLVAGDLTNTISLSWGEPDLGYAFPPTGEGPPTCSYECNASTDGSYAVLHPVIQAAVAEGITVFVASGDCGAADGTDTTTTDYPASDEDSTGVGGTVVNITTDTYESEYAWSGNGTATSSADACGNTGGAGGGWAPTPAPWYQHGYGIPNKGLRGVPDVGITAGSWLDVYCSNEADCGGTGIIEEAGTSDAAPMWAGMTTCADQIHGGDLGLINPVLYSILRSGANYNSSFHQITTGGNGYVAHAGWEPISGVGTPKANVAFPAIADGGYLPTQSTLSASLAASVTSGSASLKVTFTATVTGGTGTYKLYDFQFGDGNATPAKTNSVTYTYTRDGAFPASVEVYDSSGNSTLSTAVLISVGTTAFTLTLAANATTVTPGSPVNFTVSASGGTSPYQYSFNFGNGEYSWQNAVSKGYFDYAYQTLGTYEAQANATDSHAAPANGAVSNVVTIHVVALLIKAFSAKGPSALQNFTAVGVTTTFSATPQGIYPPYAYAYTGLPPGCSSSNAASWTCPPSTAGTYTVKVFVNDSKSNSVNTTTLLTVYPALAIDGFWASHPYSDEGVTTNLDVWVAGGGWPLTYAYKGLPAGCSSTNVQPLACDPSATGTFTVKVFVNDTFGESVTATTSLTIYPAVTISGFWATNAYSDIGVSDPLDTWVTGGAWPMSYAYTGLPAGCASSNAQPLPCTPNTAGTFTVRVYVNDSVGASVTSTLTLTIYPQLTLNQYWATNATFTVGGSTQLKAWVTGGAWPISFTYTGLPAGCSSSDTSSLHCAPNSAGTYTIRVYANDTYGVSVTATVTITVAAEPLGPAVSAPPAVRTAPGLLLPRTSG